ncbi:MAG TPA: glycosyl hydrolase family 30, partial [Algoriphagus sp.]
DQNREGLKEWVDVMFANAESSKYFSGTAVHWYESTYEVFPEALQYAHHKAPEKFLIQTEACIDAEVPRWQDDDWYWSKEAKDWGWLWAPENQKYLHPQYVPVYRYAVDIIGCFNNWVDGWIDWNMVLDRRGGPNWFENWCVAPVIVDPSNDEVYYTPLYYILAHFSKFIRPGSKIIEVKVSDDKVQATAAKNEDGSLVLVVLNQNQFKIAINLEIADYKSTFSISPAAIQTIIIGPDQTKTT